MALMNEIFCSAQISHLPNKDKWLTYKNANQSLQVIFCSG